MKHASDIQEDITFHPVSMYGSIDWVALTLGLTADTFYRKRDALYEQGFPRPDPLNKTRYLKADVEAWVARRRVVPDAVQVCDTVSGDDSGEVNFDGL